MTLDIQTIIFSIVGLLLMLIASFSFGYNEGYHKGFFTAESIYKKYDEEDGEQND